jgi:F0F1-type ATP synthase assembly protein I
MADQSHDTSISYPVKDLLEQLDKKIDNLSDKLDKIAQANEKRVSELEQKVSFISGIMKALTAFVGIFTSVLVWLHKW